MQLAGQFHSDGSESVVSKEEKSNGDDRKELGDFAQIAIYQLETKESLTSLSEPLDE